MKLQLTLIATLLSSAVFAQTTEQISTGNIEDSIKESASGLGRFRGGYYGNLGWAQSSTSVTDSTAGTTRLGGFLIEGGGYGLFNPIRDFVDIEAGIGLKLVVPATSTSEGSATKYNYGYTALTAYAGPVFRIGSTGSAIGLGTMIEIGNKTTGVTQDPFYNKYRTEMKTSFGGYFEYQYKKPDNKQIYFTRLNVIKYDLQFNDAAPVAIKSQGSNQTAFSVSAGIKF